MDLPERVGVAVAAATLVAGTLFVGAILSALFGSRMVAFLALAVGAVTAGFWWFLQETTDDDD